MKVKSNIVTLFLLICSILSVSQNLVQNPSFETMSSCPNGVSQIAKASPWQFVPGSFGSPDLFNTCCPSGACIVDLGVPTNFAGTAVPFSGDGYAGFLAYYAACLDCREYVQAPLTSPLTANSTYCISFRIRRASDAKYATNNIGMYISTGAGTQTGGNQPIPVTPQIEYTSIIQDSSIWVLVSGTYTASGGEDYITIGNFHDNAGTSIYSGNSASTCLLANSAAYYYLDSVYVGSCPAAPVANFMASDTLICEGDCIDHTDQSSSNTTDWSWTFSGANITSSTLQNPSNVCYNTSGVYTTTLIVSNSLGSDTAMHTITVNAYPTAAIIGNSTVCFGSSSILDASPNGATYLWNTGESTSSISITPTISNTYSVIVSSNNCSDSASTTIIVDQIIANAGPDVSICGGHIADLNASASGGGVFYYLWNTGESSVAISVSPTMSTTYTVIISDLLCSDDDAVSVTVLNNPIADAGTDVTILPLQTIYLNGSGGGTYQWMPSDDLSCDDCQSPLTSPQNTTTYTLIVTDANGCVSIDTVTITVETCGGIYLPNAFTPNEDGLNDIFYVKGNCIQTIALSIYNRWGEHIYETTDLSAGWNGKINDTDALAQQDIYVYKITSTDLFNISSQQTGHVSLIR